ncbi:hypothetical protein IFM89_025705 [Coptis chinensis]|uniref:Uncharacterized protein n=1 Tax=Coptis chinensis TaxID=261450 RepID=A0A835MDI6_9MAGN|nr:hypothetical protein IFM89_025705 [Coptis chinensis]
MFDHESGVLHQQKSQLGIWFWLKGNYYEALKCLHLPFEVQLMLSKEGGAVDQFQSALAAQTAPVGSFD